MLFAHLIFLLIIIIYSSILFVSIANYSIYSLLLSLTIFCYYLNSYELTIYGYGY